MYKNLGDLLKSFGVADYLIETVSKEGQHGDTYHFNAGDDIVSQMNRKLRNDRNSMLKLTQIFYRDYEMFALQLPCI